LSTHNDLVQAWQGVETRTANRLITSLAAIREAGPSGQKGKLLEFGAGFSAFATLMEFAPRLNLGVDSF